MALPWPSGMPLLPRPASSTSPSTASSSAHDDTTPGNASAGLRHLAVRAREIAVNPTSALVAMLLGLALLFVVPLVGLPFLAVVVLPAVIFHLREERRPRLGSARR